MKLGSNDISAVKIGSTDVNKVYIGSTEVWSSFTGLLDTYTGAEAAYSLRQLKSGVTNAIEVRIDTTGQPTYDIGFVNGQLDTATLEGYCTGGLDAYVTTWYDQSGNGNDATQTTASAQPQIVSSGSVILENGKPTVQFDGSDDYFTASTGFTQPFFVSTVVKNTKAASNYPYYLDSNSTGRFLLYVEDSNGIVAAAAYSASKLLTSNITKTVQSLISVLYNTTSSFIAIDSSIVVSDDIDTNNINSPIYIGSRNTTAQNMGGTFQELIFWDSDQSSNRTGIETNINAQYQIYWDGSQTSLLDSYSGSAAAYSLRALSSSYTGPLVEVRRASDNATTDIYAKYDGTLNVDALESFCSGTNGFVTTWYDQSGNGYDATQTTASAQPQIVSSGSVITENGKPTIDFDGSDDTLFLSYGPNDNAMSVFNVYKSINNAASETNTQTLYHFGNVLVSNYCGKVSTSGALSGELITYNFNSGRLGSSTYSRNAQVCESEFWLQSGFTAYQNTNQYTLNLSSGWTTSTDSSPNGLGGLGSNYLSIGSIYVNSAFIAHTNIKVQEIIFYPSDQSSNRTGIETNINDFYSIY